MSRRVLSHKTATARGFVPAADAAEAEGVHPGTIRNRVAAGKYPAGSIAMVKPPDGPPCRYIHQSAVGEGFKRLAAVTMESLAADRLDRVSYCLDVVREVKRRQQTVGGVERLRGKIVETVAHEQGLARVTVYRWLKAYDEGGADALLTKFGGATCRLQRVRRLPSGAEVIPGDRESIKAQAVQDMHDGQATYGGPKRSQIVAAVARKYGVSRQTLYAWVREQDARDLADDIDADCG